MRRRARTADASLARCRLLLAVAREVERVGGVDTVDGQLALLLAARTESAAASRLLEPLRELRKTVARLRTEEQ
jgi:hypothetical protein